MLFQTEEGIFVNVKHMIKISKIPITEKEKFLKKLENSGDIFEHRASYFYVLLENEETHLINVAAEINKTQLVSIFITSPHLRRSIWLSDADIAALFVEYIGKF